MATRKIKDLNPIPQYDIGGTDLGIPFRMPNGKIGLVLGDTFGGTQTAVGGPHWRSPVIVTSDSHDPTQPIVISGACRNGEQLVDYQHDNAEFSTVLPCDAISIGSRIYLWVMYTKGLGNERYCKIWTSDNLGQTWDTSGPQWSTSIYGGKRVMVTWDRGDDGFVYIISTGGLARNKNAILFRCPEDKLTDPAAWQPWGWNGSWGWGNHPGDDPTRGILPDNTKLGEICLRNIQGNFVFSGFDSGAYNAFVKVAAKVTDNWHTAKTSRPVTGSTVPQLYGCYIHPDSRFGKQWGLIVSQWKTATGNPYRSMQYVIDGLTAAKTPVERPDYTTITTNEGWGSDMSTPEQIAEVTVGTTTDYDVNAPGGSVPQPTNLWGAVKRILFEATLWLLERSKADLDATKDKPDTVLGHAVRAASWGRLTYAQGEQILANQVRIEAKLDALANREI